jgi:osmotically inducible lipoprotein OsmB
LSAAINTKMRHGHSYRAAVLSGAALAVFGLGSCDTYVGQGAGFGAATGAVVGAAATGTVRGAAAGAAIGAGTGALIGAAISEEQAARYGPPPAGGYVVAQWSSSPGFVQSPCPPHRLVDVRAIPRGALVRDPSSGCIFRRP